MSVMTLSDRSIYLAKRRRVVLGTQEGQTPTSVVASANRNLEALGFTFSGRLISALLSQPQEEVEKLYREIVPVLKEMTGNHRKFKPMYPNFPAQVLEATDLELYWNAMVHYWSAWVADVTGHPEVITLPHYEKSDRPELQQEVKLKVIDLGSIEDFNGVFTALVGSNASLSESDKAIVSWFVDAYLDGVQHYLPASIPQKENLAFLVAALTKRDREPTYLLPSLKTATDVLRVAVGVSDGDVSLAKPTKFRRLKRKERRFFLDALESCGDITEDMLRHKEVWKRLGREIRPGDWKTRYPKSWAAFDVIRNDKPFETFNSMVEAAFKARQVGEILGLLQARPGSFARRLDHAVRTATFAGALDVVDAFLSVADKVSTPVLLQVYNHFKNRATNFNSRSFFPKGNIGKVQVSDVPLPLLSQELTQSIANDVRIALIERFRALPPLGKVFIDESLHQQIVPFAQRSASRSLRTIARGSRMPMPDTDVVRFFLWWKDGSGRTDIDLSMTAYNESWEQVANIAYYNLRELGGCHSGDITSAPNGACEFIDISIKKMIESGCRFMTMNVHSFSEQLFSSLPECFAGWMGRNAPGSGEVFDARTVEDKIDLTAESKVGIPMVFDLKERQVIWTDLSLKAVGMFNNAKSSRNGVVLMSRAMVELNKPNLYDLFEMHALARGVLSDREGADTIFSMHEGVTPFDGDIIASQYMI